MVILGKTKVKDALDRYPELGEVLVSLSPKYKRLTNKRIYNTVARWATFNDVARMGGLSVCTILHTLNEKTGMVSELEKVFPECIQRVSPPAQMEKPRWVESVKQLHILDVRNREDFFFTEIMTQLADLNVDTGLKIVHSFYPAPLIGMLEEEGYEYFYEENPDGTVHLYIKFKQQETHSDWRDFKEEFELFDVRSSREDPFGAIIEKAQSTPPGQGFTLVQKFEPIPLINILVPMGFEYETVEVGFFEYHIYFYKVVSSEKESGTVTDQRIPLVIQAATPVVLPLVIRLLKSRRLMEKIRIRELKVWKETEKHMAWIVNGKADITFSAVAAAAKLFLTGNDIRMTSIDIWDNFYVLTRGYNAQRFSDLKGHDFYIPLYKGAPPYAITEHLMKASGENPDEYTFVFGTPFGRPEEMQQKLVAGEIDTVLLREPEASFALYEGKGAVTEAFSYGDVWKELNGTSKPLPNAGVIVKGEMVRKYPEIVKILDEELSNSVKWINENPEAAADQSFDLMGGSTASLELFLKRVTYRHEKAQNSVEDSIEYLKLIQGDKGFSYLGDNEEVRKLFEL